MLPDIPRALSTVALGRGSGAYEGEQEALAKDGLLPCHICITRVSPMRVDGWLGELETLAQGGDLAGVQARLAALRAEIQGDLAVQERANRAGEGEA
jgi:hypothetical protein